MHLFLTSSPSGCPFDPGPEIPVLDEANGFADRLRSVWPATPPRGLLLAADPGCAEVNDRIAAVFAACLARAGLPLDGMAVCDGRNGAQLPALLARSGFVMLCGGHVPTQNRFFAAIGAAKALRSWEGVVLGVSAGTMNAARQVYAQPEEPGEAADPAFARWLPGLALTEANILPHFQKTRDWAVDGLRLLEDIALPDSYGHCLYALPDGSYVYSDGRHETLYGEAWRIAEGRMEKLCENGQSVRLR